MNKRIAIIDADLVGRKRHRFPNLVCMKLSGYHKERGDAVVLKQDYDGLAAFDRVYLAKVFTDTAVPPEVLRLPNVVYGGTGFFYDKATPLPDAIEHHMPDYHLYDGWVKSQLAAGKRRQEFRCYLDYSIGYLTRGCFRHCAFCVNQHYNRVMVHSPLAEFLAPDRKKICLLDDNFFGCPSWKNLLDELQATGMPFQFKQGLDERLLTEERCEALVASKYDGEYIFAFDNIADAPLIEQKIQLLRRYTPAVCRFYCFTGFDRAGKWDAAFWHRDIVELLERIRILMRYRCLPYVMRFERYVESPYRGVYVTLARWCNQPAFFKKNSFRQFCEAHGENSATMRYANEFEHDWPEIAQKYYDLRWEELQRM